jgi:dTDP-4-amino-4,6-dideoxygalactose transaminase
MTNLNRDGQKEAIPFNVPSYSGNEDKYVRKAIEGRKLSGDGPFGGMCTKWFENRLRRSKCLLTPSCTHALELAAILINTEPGDEIIMPSFTFSSTANAFVLRGAKIAFVDIDAENLNIDPSRIEAAINDKTKAIVVVHYAGVSCDMSEIMRLANKHNLYVVEDAAQAIGSEYKGEPLGTLGHLATYSFHETKNITCGEGGLLIINDTTLFDRAEIIREKGTNRTLFHRGQVDKYRWIDLGSSYLPTELQAAYLWGQLEGIETILEHRMHAWQLYSQELQQLETDDLVHLPKIPQYAKHNAHIFFIKTTILEDRAGLINYLRANQIDAVFHYIPLHSSPAGERFGYFHGHDVNTTSQSNRLIRLPLWYGLTEAQVLRVVATIKEYFSYKNQ